MRTPSLIVTLLTLVALSYIGGCAASYTEPPLPAGHPANPDAPQSRPIERPGALDLAGADPVLPAGHDMPAALYTCPMHPEVKSTLANSRCTVCDMKLKPASGIGGAR